MHYYHFATILELIKIMYNFYYKNLFKKFPRRLIPLKFLIPWKKNRLQSKSSLQNKQSSEYKGNVLKAFNRQETFHHTHITRGTVLSSLHRSTSLILSKKSTHLKDRLIKNRLPVLSNTAVLSRARICKINLGEPAWSRKEQEWIDKIGERERERRKRNEKFVPPIESRSAAAIYRRLEGGTSKWGWRGAGKRGRNKRKREREKVEV